MKLTSEQQAKFEALLDEAKCPECEGNGIDPCQWDKGQTTQRHCPACKGTGNRYEIALIDPNAELPKISEIKHRDSIVNHSGNTGVRQYWAEIIASKQAAQKGMLKADWVQRV